MDREQIDAMLDAGVIGCRRLLALQTAALGGIMTTTSEHP
jgi:hypothetical protein